MGRCQNDFMQTVDVLIQGAGIVGTSLALSLSQRGLRVALRSNTGPRPDTDVRAYALNAASVTLLRALRVWDALPRHAITPVYDMRIEGDAHSMLEFSAWQQGVSELAWIVDVSALEQALATAAKFSPNIQLLDTLNPRPQAALTAICEGKHSALRDTLPGVHVTQMDYQQTAIAARLTASVSHAGVARQWFRSPDVLALLPCTDAAVGQAAYALVWSLPTDRASQLMAASDGEFEAALADAVPTESGVGTLALASSRACWPLSRATASPWCGLGWVLLGDAAHVVHPLAGQGLNLGLADVIALTEVLDQREKWRSLGDIKLLRRYERRRALPTRMMIELTSGLAHLFAHPSPWVGEVRNRGMSLAQNVPGIKRWLTGKALG